VDNTNTIYVAAARVGAAFPGALSVRTGVAGLPAARARMQHPALAAGWLEARSAVFQLLPAPTSQPAPMSGELPAVAVNSKHAHVTKTRISAGGYGAMGPHPEREPA
jgi:hypothetical protein